MKFPFNGAEIVIPRDNSISINTLATVESFFPQNWPSHDMGPSLASCEKQLKIMSIGMGEYTLDSIITLPISPRSYGRPSDKMKPSASTMTIFDIFIQSSILLEVEKEEQAIQD